MIDFVLCDDNFQVLTKLEKMLEALFIKHHYDAQISLKTTESNELLDYLKSNKANVLFLDIDLKANVSGLDIANQIRKTDKDIYIIFTTIHLEYGFIAYKCKTFDYLPKPLTMQKLEETVVRLFEDLNGNPISYVRLDNNKTIIKRDSIKYIQKQGMKVVFHTDTRDYETYSSFKKILPQLPRQFVQCHKSYIVNMEKISNVQANTGTIYLNNDKDTCYIGPKYKNKFMEVFNYGNFTNSLDGFDNTKRNFS